MMAPASRWVLSAKNLIKVLCKIKPHSIICSTKQWNSDSRPRLALTPTIITAQDFLLQPINPSYLIERAKYRPEANYCKSLFLFNVVLWVDVEMILTVNVILQSKQSSARVLSKLHQLMNVLKAHHTSIYDDILQLVHEIFSANYVVWNFYLSCCYVS